MQEEQKDNIINIKGVDYIEVKELCEDRCDGCHLLDEDDRCMARGLDGTKCGDRPIVYAKLSSIIKGKKKLLII